MKRKLCVIIALIITVLLSQQTVFAVELDEVLLDRLVEKGLITLEDAAIIRAETAIKTQEELELKRTDKYNVEGKTKFGFGGYLQLQYNATQSVFSESRIRRARIDVKGDIPENISWRLQMDTVQPLKRVLDSLALTQNPTTKDVSIKTTTTTVVTRPVLLDATIDYKFPSFIFRVGQFKLPFGRENLESSPKLDTINRSQVTEKLVPGRDIGSQGRDIGALVSGIYAFSSGKMVDYSIGVFNGAGINVGDDNNSKDIAVRLLTFPAQGLTCGTAYYSGKSGPDRKKKLRTGFELSYITPTLSLKSEYVTGKEGLIKKYGWYGQLGYKFHLQKELVLKFDRLEPDKTKVNDRSSVWTLGLNWFLNKSSKIQANYEWKTEEGKKIDNNTFLTQFQVQF